MKTTLSALVLSTAVVAGMASSAMAMEAGDIILRGRAIDVIPQEDASISAIGGDVSINSNIVPELDLSYFVTKNIAFELIAATTKHEATAKGTGLGDLDLGSVWLLPPTLTAQYHFDTETAFKPYVGAGINYTMFYNDKAGSSINDIKYDNSIGGALQVGFDYAIDDHWMLNADVKKVWINSDVSINGGAVRADVDIDPVIVGFGVGYKF